MSTTNEAQVVLILKELELYKKNKSNAKELFQSMKDVSAWLAEKEK